MVPGELRTIDELLAFALDRTPKLEIVFPDNSYTLTELEAWSRGYAELLSEVGVGPGDKVGLFLEPRVDFLTALSGIMRCGATLVPISERSKAHELRHIVPHADLVALITSRKSDRADFPGRVLEAFPDLDRGLPIEGAPLLRAVFVLDADGDSGGFTAVKELPDGARAPDHTNEPEDFAYILYTSGTQAEPKGCLTTHRAVAHQAVAVALTRYELRPGDAFWCPLPLVHTGGLTTLMACLAGGADYAHTGWFDPDTALDLLESRRCTHAIPAFETIWLRILDHPRFESADLSRLRVVLNTGSPERLRELQARVPQAVQLSTFGATEGGGHISMSKPSDSLLLRSTTGGHPIPGMEARVVDPETGADLPAGEVGEVLYRGATRFGGYYKNPELDAETIDADGWFHTGDLGTLDADGRLTFRGRLKDMLKVGGENVAAPEVEAFLLGHPAVNIVAVVGVADAVYNEVPAAFVELVPGATCTEREMIDFCLGRIATYKVPRYVRFVDEWPMAGIKIRKVELRERLERELAEAGITAAPRIDSPG